jgi:hypothetical protein
VEDGAASSPESAMSSRPRNLSMSSAVSAEGSGGVPVIFCGNNFEREIPVREDLGLEFGFGVMSLMTEVCMFIHN